MALPIRGTPVLTGKASVRFNRLMEENKDKRLSLEERERLAELCQKILAKAKL